MNRGVGPILYRTLKLLVPLLLAVLLTSCAGTPTKINELNLENPGVASGIALSGILISDGGKFILDKSFHPQNTDLSVRFIFIPVGPWKFNGSTLFPEFNSLSRSCKSGKACDRYKQYQGPFNHVDCLKFYYAPNSRLTYSERLQIIEREQKRIEEKKKKDTEDTKLTGGDVAAGSVIVVGAGVYAVVMAPLLILYAGANELGVCEGENIVWFDHDKFIDRVKKTIKKDYGSLDAYVADIKQASVAYKALTSINNKKRGEIENLIQEWRDSKATLLPEDDSINNYQTRYSPYSLVKIPRKAVWGVERTFIEFDLLSHYTKQLESVSRQLDLHNEVLKKKYGIDAN